MRDISFRLSLVFTAVSLADPALAQQGPADFTRGQELAANVCAFCHDVTADQSDSSLNGVPPFAEISNKPGQSPEGLAEAIVFPHPDMPKVSFTTRDLRDIVAYIMSLRTRD